MGSVGLDDFPVIQRGVFQSSFQSFEIDIRDAETLLKSLRELEIIQ